MIFVLAVSIACAAGVRGVWSPCGLSMLSTLNPVSHAARGLRFSVTAGWYVAGALAGGAVLGAGCAAFAYGVDAVGLAPRVAAVIAALGAAAAVLSDSKVTRWHLPVHPRQVNEQWVGAYRRWVYVGGFGWQIGTGFATYIMTAGVYLTALLAVLTGSAGQALLVGVVFGGVRGLMILIVAPVRDAGSLRALMAAIERHGSASLRVTVAVEALAAGAVMWTVAGWLGAGVAALLLVLAFADPGAERHARSGTALVSSVRK